MSITYRGNWSSLGHLKPNVQFELGATVRMQLSWSVHLADLNASAHRYTIQQAGVPFSFFDFQTNTKVTLKKVI